MYCSLNLARAGSNPFKSLLRRLAYLQRGTLAASGILDPAINRLRVQTP